MSFIDDLKYKYARLNALDKLIVFNVAIFLVVLLLKPFLLPVLKWLELRSDFTQTLLQPWSVLTYAFLHYDFFHLLFNMLWLYFIGRLFLNLFNVKTALNVYFLGAISGGVLFLIGYDIFPQVFATSAYLIGASAAVRALLIFLCAYLPNQEVRFFTFNIKLYYIGIAVVAIDAIGVLGDNAGGNLAHLGGAVSGYIYAKQLAKGHDIGSGFGKLMDTISGWFSAKKSYKFKNVYKNTNKDTVSQKEFKDLNKQKQIDSILDKISKSGYESLTKAEKDFLFRAGK
jgi:membrane associated rhomboid family serine protease